MFAWRYLGADSEELGESHRFPDREAAEGWMGEAWAGLLERGVDAVELVSVEDRRSVYRMALAEAEESAER